MKTPIRILCALLLAAAMVCVCFDWLGAPNGLPDGASFGAAIDPLLLDGSLTGAELFTALPSLADGDPSVFGGVPGLVCYLISVAATALTLLLCFIELLLHLCGRKSRGWGLPLPAALSAAFAVLLLLYAQGEYGQDVLTLRPAPVVAFAATLASALIWRVCWREPRAALPEDDYGEDDGEDYARGYDDEYDYDGEEELPEDDYDDEPERPERYRPPQLGPQVYTPGAMGREPTTFAEPDRPPQTERRPPEAAWQGHHAGRRVPQETRTIPRPDPQPRRAPYDQDAEPYAAQRRSDEISASPAAQSPRSPDAFDRTRVLPRQEPGDQARVFSNAQQADLDQTRVLPDPKPTGGHDD
mgnify:CR=1 FL=1